MDKKSILNQPKNHELEIALVKTARLFYDFVNSEENAAAI